MKGWKEFLFPRPHIVIDDFFDKRAYRELKSEILNLQGQFHVGLPGGPENRYNPVKNNENTVITKSSKRGRNLYHLVDQQFNSKGFIDFMANTRVPIYRPDVFFNYDRLHVSRYGNGHFYDEHLDFNPTSNLTFIYLLALKPNSFQGGNFELRFRNEIKRIAFRSNRVIVFPSDTLHRVTPVKAKSDKFQYGRFSIQIWPVTAAPIVKPIRKGKSLIVDTSISHYLEPYFGFELRTWREFERHFASFDVAKRWDDGAATLDAILTALSRQLEYLARDVMRWERPTSRCALLNAKENEGRRAEIVCRNRIHGHGRRTQKLNFELGYWIVQDESGLGIQLFLNRNGQLKATKIPASADKKESRRKLATLMKS